MRLLKACTILLLTAVFGPTTFAQGTTTTFDGYADILYANNKKIQQDIYYKSSHQFNAQINVIGYYYKSADDSMRMFSIALISKIKEGVNSLRMDYSGSNNYHLNADFSKILRDKGLVIPGTYKIRLSVINVQDKDTFSYTALRQVDSNIDFTTGIGKGLASKIANLGINMPRISSNAQQTRAANKMGRLAERYFTKKGLTQVKYDHGDSTTIELYYNNWFVGRYEVDKNNAGAIIGRAKALVNNSSLGAFTGNQMDNYESLMSQIRKMKKEARENKQLEGDITLSTNYSSDQEEYSDMDNAYYDIGGAISLPIFDIPVSVEGYYTSQDKKREAKASYLHFHYDVDKAKEQLSQLINSYNERMGQTLSRKSSYEDIYGTAIQNLEGEKNNALNSLKRTLGTPEIDLSSLNEQAIEDMMKQKALTYGSERKQNILDSLNNKINANRKVEDAKTRALRLYQKVMDLENRIATYKQKLEQYKKVAEYDSALAFDKMQEAKDLSKMSYKDMVKAASDILPQGKVKSFTTGLTNLDLGMFSKRLSDYTFAGQRLNGIDAGYDIGFSTIGVSYGSVEYLGRDGSVDKYKAYSVRIQSKAVMGQQVGLIYYGYAPSNRMLKDNDFFNSDAASLPSFKNPSQIVSLQYTGDISKLVTINGEIAYSDVTGQSEAAKRSVPFKDRLSYNIKVDGQVPKTNFFISGSYESVGSDFQNNTLPYILSGVNRYAVSVNGTLFKSFLRLGVEYSGLLQHNLYSQSRNNQWGFDISTYSKRFPTVYLSYKPFSTFRSFDDTLSIAQKPILGSVWSGRVNYQFRRNGHAWRTVLLYNRNNSLSDIDWINDDIVNQDGGSWSTPQGWGIGPFLVAAFGSNGGFVNPLLDEAVKNHLFWTTTQLDHPLDFYLGHSAPLLSQAVNIGLPVYYDALGSYDSAAVWKGLLAENQNAFSPLLLNPLWSATDPAVQHNALMALAAATPPLCVDVLYQLGFTGLSSTMDTNILYNILRSAIDKQGVGAVTNAYRITAAPNGYNAPDAFIQRIMTDPVITRWILDPHNAAGVLPALQHFLDIDSVTTGNKVAFFSQWIPGSFDTDWLNETINPKGQLNIVYDAGRDTFMTAYLDGIGLPAVNTTLHGIPGLTGTNYTGWVQWGINNGTLNPNYTPPSVNTPDPDNLLGENMYLAEQHLYGSSRLGIQYYDAAAYRQVYVNGTGLTDTSISKRLPWYSFAQQDWIKADEASEFTGATYNQSTDTLREQRELGMKQYELTDHLGNVLATVLDRKTGYGSSSGNYIGFSADVASVTDYYPFGMPISERSIVANNLSPFRFGFNNNENDNEVYGKGSLQDFGDRLNDSRIGRLNMSLDPLAEKFPWQSPYIFAGNNPIKFIDKNGALKIDPSIQRDYPLIYLYLSTQLLKDVMKSTLIKQAYKEINPDATDANIKNIFTNNSGPALFSIGNPYGYFDAPAHTDYSQDVSSTIEINDKVFKYVESKLKGNGSLEEKQVALMRLYTLVLHEIAHEICGYNGTDEKGADTKVPKKEQREIENGEPGARFDQAVWLLPDLTDFTNKKKDVIQGLSYPNPSNKEGIMENVIKNAESTEGGKESLPTVPDKKPTQ